MNAIYEMNRLASLIRFDEGAQDESAGEYPELRGLPAVGPAARNRANPPIETDSANCRPGPTFTLDRNGGGDRPSDRPQPGDR